VRAVQYTEREGPEVLNVIQIRALQPGADNGAAGCLTSIDEFTLWVEAQRQEEAIVQCPSRPDNAEFPTW
jgi:hypothetical protein|tara:strand:+ start:1246 stop:1455 length:210 start_codon:yes stop_codon:yes gene_type:complete